MTRGGGQKTKHFADLIYGSPPEREGSPREKERAWNCSRSAWPSRAPQPQRRRRRDQHHGAPGKRGRERAGFGAGAGVVELTEGLAIRNADRWSHLYTDRNVPPIMLASSAIPSHCTDNFSPYGLPRCWPSVSCLLPLASPV